MNGTDFFEQLENVLKEKNLVNNLLQTRRGCYCNLNKITSFDNEFAYFDHEERVKIPLTLAVYQELLQNYFPPFRTDYKKQAISSTELG